MPPTKAPMTPTTRFRIRPPPPNRTPTIQPAINPFSAIMIRGVNGRICSSVVIARSSCSTPPNFSVSNNVSWGMNPPTITDPAMQSGHSWWFHLPVYLVEVPDQKPPDCEHIENDADGVFQSMRSRCAACLDLGIDPRNSVPANLTAETSWPRVMPVSHAA